MRTGAGRPASRRSARCCEKNVSRFRSARTAVKKLRSVTANWIVDEGRAQIAAHTGQKVAPPSAQSGVGFAPTKVRIPLMARRRDTAVHAFQFLGQATSWRNPASPKCVAQHAPRYSATKIRLDQEWTPLGYLAAAGGGVAKSGCPFPARRAPEAHAARNADQEGGLGLLHPQAPCAAALNMALCPTCAGPIFGEPFRQGRAQHRA